MNIDSSLLPDGFLPMVVYCLGIYFLVLCTRSVIETRWPSIVAWPGWKKMLRIAPVMFGGVGALIMFKYPYLDRLPTRGTRFIYGSFAGGMSSFGYMVFKAVVQKFFGVKVDGDSLTPPPGQP